MMLGGAAAIAAANDTASAACRFAAQGDGTVSAVIDGRTFRLADGREIRLAGIETATAKNAAAALTSLIGGRDVSLHGENDRPDRYGRQPAIVFIQGADTSIQTELLSRGEAIANATLSDKTCSAEWVAAEAAARTEKRGIWGDPAATKNAESPGDIQARIGQFTVVEGTVVSGRQAGATFYVNFGRQWARDFAVTIPGRIMPAFKEAGIDLAALQYRRVRVRGWVETRGGPRIEATKTGQIELIGADGVVAKNIVPEGKGK
jgi:endonuclease YncB( thermonuclease family)